MKLGVFFVVITSAILLGLSNYDNKIVRAKRWNPTKYERMPTSIHKNIDLTVFSDYFRPSKNNDKIKYNISVDFWTNKDTDQLKNTALISAKEGLLKAATTVVETIPNSKILLTKLLQNGLLESFTDSFVNSPNISKMSKGVFQIDINFNPINDTWSGFEPELLSNQLIKVGTNDSLVSKMEESTNSVVENILNTTFPPVTSKEKYRYSGGVITLWIKLLNKPQSGAELPRAIDGYVRYRRYYQMSNSFIFDNLLISGTGESLYPRIKSIKPSDQIKGKTEYATIDIYKTFNKHSYLPSLHRMEVHLGKLIPVIHRKANTINRTIANRPKTITSSNFQINLNLIESTKKINKSIPLGALTYMFREETITHLPQVPGGKYNDIASNLISKFSKKIVTGLELNRFHNSLQKEKL